MATSFPLVPLSVPVSERDHILGPAAAPVSLLEYGDYECPDCGRAYFVIEELRRLAGDTFSFAFRNFPLMQKHTHAEHAAEAAEAAGAQGKFWEMHDTLFQHQQALGDADLVLHATSLDLDTSRFLRDLASHTYAARVAAHIAGGIRSGVKGTPTVFINDIRHAGPHDLASLRTAIERAARA